MKFYLCEHYLKINKLSSLLPSNFSHLPAFPEPSGMDSSCYHHSSLTLPSNSQAFVNTNERSVTRKEICFLHLPQSQPSLPSGFASLLPALSCLLLLLCFFTKVSFKLFPSPFYQGSAFSYLFCPSELLNSSSGTMPGRSSGKAAAHPACGQSHAAAPAWNQTLL